MSLGRRRRGGLNPGGGFSPKAIPGLVAWFDASYITDLNDGDSITTWNDLSGNGYHATQATAAAKPVYKVNIINGKPVVRFDGTEDYLAVPTGARPASSYTVFIVVAINDLVPTTAYRIVSTLDSGGITGLVLLRISGAAWRHSWGTGSAVSNVNGGTIATGVFDILVIQHDGTGYLFENGASVGTPVTSVYSEGTNDVEIGSTSSGGIGLLNGDIAALGIYSPSISTVNIARLNRYLSSRFAITLP